MRVGGEGPTDVSVLLEFAKEKFNMDFASSRPKEIDTQIKKMSGTPLTIGFRMATRGAACNRKMTARSPTRCDGTSQAENGAQAISTTPRSRGQIHGDYISKVEETRCPAQLGLFHLHGMPVRSGLTVPCESNFAI